MRAKWRKVSRVVGEYITIKVERSTQVVSLTIRSMATEGIISYLELNMRVIGAVE